MLRVAVIGLGNIAGKAYLPALGVRPGLDLHLMTRNPDTLAALGDSYRIAPDRRFTDLAALVRQPLDAAFVHVPTDQHAPVVARLLDAGIPTYVDKPLADDLADAHALAERSERTGVPLAVGFNRRHAPAYLAARQRPRDLIVHEKNTDGPGGAVRHTVYDDFIHVVDTLRFLAPGPVRDTVVAGATSGGALDHVTLTLRGAGWTGIGIMHRRSGVKEERLAVTGGGHRHEVLDLTTVISASGGDRTRRGGDGWAPVADQRGITGVCAAFLDRVTAGDRAALHADLQDALRTHELCEQVVRDLG